MNKQLNNTRQLSLLIGGIVAILVSAIAIAALATSDRYLMGSAAADPAEQTEATAIAAPSGRAGKCAECGVIESTREIGISAERIEVKTASRSVAGNRINLKEPAPTGREITIRMQDGSMFVITDAYPAQWKQGERVKILAGVN